MLDLIVALLTGVALGALITRALAPKTVVATGLAAADAAVAKEATTLATDVKTDVSKAVADVKSKL